MHLRQEGQKKALHFACLGGLTGPGLEILVLLFLSVLSNPRAPVHHMLFYILVPVTHIKNRSWYQLSSQPEAKMGTTWVL